MEVTIAAAVAFTAANFLAWGHWPICRRVAAGAPSQPFGVLMVVTQTACAWAACCCSPHFFGALVADSTHPLAVLCVVGGGAALAIGDFAAAAAIEELGVAVGGPVCFSCMLIVGSIGNFLLEGSAHPGLLWLGIAGCMAAVLADSQSHSHDVAAVDRLALAKADSAAEMAPQTAQQVVPPQTASPEVPRHKIDIAVPPLEGGASSAEEPTPAPRPPSHRVSLRASDSNFKKGMVVAVGGGAVGGLWTVLSTLASRVHALDPLVLLFYFHLGELLFITPVVLLFGRLFGGVTSARRLYAMVRALSRWQALWTCAAGLCIAVGYLCYFATKGAVPRAVAYAFGCSAGSTGMVYGLCCFGEYAGAARSKKALLLLALLLYPSAIATLALSMI